MNMASEGELGTGRSGPWTILAGALAGTAIGESLGLLREPSPQLQKQVRESSTNLSKEMSKAADGFPARSRDKYERARDVAAKAGEEIDRMSGDATKKTEGWSSQAV